MLIEIKGTSGNKYILDIKKVYLKISVDGTYSIRFYDCNYEIEISKSEYEKILKLEGLNND